MAEKIFSKVMLLSEGTGEGMQATRTAIELAASAGADLHILAVVDTNALKQLLTNRIFVEDEMREYDQELERSSCKQIDYVAQLAAKHSVRYETHLLRGAIHTAVLQHQKQSGADLFVMGAFRASTIRAALVAREKQLIIEEIPCPVLLVPASRERGRQR